MRRPTFGGKGRKACYNLTLVTSSHLQKREREREREIVGMQHRMLSFGSVWSLPTGSNKCLKFDLLWLWVNRQWACQFHCFVEFISFLFQQTKSVKQRVYALTIYCIYIYIWYKPSQVCICCLQKLCSLVWVKPSPLLVGWLGWVWLDASDLNTNEQHITSHLPISMTCKFKLSLITNLPFSCICVFTTF